MLVSYVPTSGRRPSECQIDFTGMTGIARKKNATNTIATYEIHSRMLSLTSRTTDSAVRRETSHKSPQAMSKDRHADGDAGR